MTADRDSEVSPLLRPAMPLPTGIQSILILSLLFSSALLILLAAWAMPAGYSWQIHSISESAAQSQINGWIARLAFLTFGAAVILLAVSMRLIWPWITYWCALIFAASMFGVAAFSHAPWLPGIPGDDAEDLLHSVFATGMGFAFVLGVVVRFVHRGRGSLPARSLDVFAVLIATVLPVMLATVPSMGGVMQRVMFVVGYIWFGREALFGRREKYSNAA